MDNNIIIDLYFTYIKCALKAALISTFVFRMLRTEFPFGFNGCRILKSSFAIYFDRAIFVDVMLHS